MQLTQLSSGQYWFIRIQSKVTWATQEGLPLRLLHILQGQILWLIFPTTAGKKFYNNDTRSTNKSKRHFRRTCKTSISETSKSEASRSLASLLQRFVSPSFFGLIFLSSFLFVPSQQCLYSNPSFSLPLLFDRMLVFVFFCLSYCQTVCLSKYVFVWLNACISGCLSTSISW
jgi:hypothetical protein